MDRVRFGKALGTGTREMAKTLARATSAALAPDPRGPSKPAQATGTTVRQTPQPRAARSASIPSRADLRQGSQRFQQGVFKPFAKASGVLWFEFTGSFFGLFALAMAVETWKKRVDLRPGVILSGHAWLAPALFAIFAYFAVSSFVRAHRRSRR